MGRSPRERQAEIRRHYRQASTILRRIHETELLWGRCETLARRHRLPDRTVGVLCDAARGWPFRRSLYVKTVRSSSGDEISDETATRDLRALSGAGLLEAVGERRGRSYVPTAEVRQVWTRIREQRRDDTWGDPYELVARRAQPPLPGLGSA